MVFKYVLFLTQRRQECILCSVMSLRSQRRASTLCGGERIWWIKRWGARDVQVEQVDMMRKPTVRWNEKAYKFYYTPELTYLKHFTRITGVVVLYIVILRVYQTPVIRKRSKFTIKVNTYVVPTVIHMDSRWLLLVIGCLRVDGLRTSVMLGFRVISERSLGVFGIGLVLVERISNRKLTTEVSPYGAQRY